VLFGKSIVALVTNGSLVFQGKASDYPGKLIFSEDNVHPNAHTGHRLYTEALIRAMNRIAEKKHPFKHLLPAAFIADNWEAAQMLSVSDLPKTGAWVDVAATQDTIGAQFRQKFPQLFKANQAGATIQLAFTGRVAGLYDIMGPGCGQYSVTIDHTAATLYPRFDKYGNYYRSTYFLLPLMENKEHSIEWKVSDQKPDKLTILKQNGKDPGNDSTRYNENACYAGWLLIIGKLK
jgi:hypothetical protein